MDVCETTVNHMDCEFYRLRLAITDIYSINKHIETILSPQLR